jgi:hypothetical protein
VNSTGALIRIPNARSEPPAALPASEPAGLAEWFSARREEIVRQLETWQAPALPNEVLDALAAIYLVQAGHRLMPFFVWLEDRLKR